MFNEWVWLNLSRDSLLVMGTRSSPVWEPLDLTLAVVCRWELWWLQFGRWPPCAPALTVVCAQWMIGPQQELWLEAPPFPEGQGPARTRRFSQGTQFCKVAAARDWLCCLGLCSAAVGRLRYDLEISHHHTKVSLPVFLGWPHFLPVQCPLRGSGGAPPQV